MYIFCSDLDEEGAGGGRVHGDGVREGDVGEDGNGGGGRGEDDVDGKDSDGDDEEISGAEEEGPGEEEEIDETVSSKINEDEGIGLII